MAHDIFTYLLLERLKNITNPAIPREDANVEYQAFMAELANAHIDQQTINLRQKEVQALNDEFSRLQSQFREIRNVDLELSDEVDAPQFIRDIARQIKDLEYKINLQKDIAVLSERIRQLESRSPMTPQDDPMQVIIQEYLVMTNILFQSITPETHIWFLERMLAQPKLLNNQNLHRLEELYDYYHSIGVIQYLIMNILCTQENRGVQHITNIANHIISNYQLTLSQESPQQLIQFINMLLEIATDTAIDALRNIIVVERRSRLNQMYISQHIRERLRELSMYYSEQVIAQLNGLLEQ